MPPARRQVHRSGPFLEDRAVTLDIVAGFRRHARAAASQVSSWKLTGFANEADPSVMGSRLIDLYHPA
jgi:hypothetical protein